MMLSFHETTMVIEHVTAAVKIDGILGEIGHRGDLEGSGGI